MTMVLPPGAGLAVVFFVVSRERRRLVGQRMNEVTT